MRKYVAEFIGTAIVVFLGCGCMVASNALFGAMGIGLPLAYTTLISALTFGIAVIGVTYFTGDISGAHVNPAVSLAMLISGRMDIRDFTGYILGQFAGGIAGAALLMAVLHSRVAMGANGYGMMSTFGIPVLTAVIVEFVLTFILVSAFLGNEKRKTEGRESAAAYGIVYAGIYMFGIPFTGGGANPARSLGPALIQGDDTLVQVWLFVLVPLLAGAAAAGVYKLLNKEAAGDVSSDEVNSEEAEVTVIEEENEYSESDGDYDAAENDDSDAEICDDSDAETCDDSACQMADEDKKTIAVEE